MMMKLPSMRALLFPGDSGGGGGTRKNVLWIEGLRGIASFLVILTHIARAWDYDLFSSTGPPAEAAPRILQLPILRIPWQGRVGVTIFGFLTGYVCALKPIKLARSGNHSAGLIAIAKSAFRRPPRLMLPATIAMCISWTAAQFGAFTVANRSDSGWTRYASPDLEPTLWGEVLHLFRSFVSVWTNGQMDYDDHQWALLPLLKGSMEVFVVLCATIYMKYHYRLLTYSAMFMYFHVNNKPNTETFGMQLFFGMFLSDIAQHPAAQEIINSPRWIRKTLVLVLIFSGLYVASYPADNPEWCAWSRNLQNLSHYIFPANVYVPKRYTAMGVDLVILGIFFSPSAKDFLSSRYLLWLGKNSFAVYLTHGTLLRTVLVWLIYGISGQPWVETKNEQGEVVPPPWLPRGGPLAFAIGIPIWLVVVYTCAHFWTNYVDTWCARLTQKLENRVFEEDEKSAPLLPA